VDQARAAGAVIEFERSAPIIVDRSLYRELVKAAISRTVTELEAKVAAREEERKAARQSQKSSGAPADPAAALEREHRSRMRELSDHAHGVTSTSAPDSSTASRPWTPQTSTSLSRGDQAVSCTSSRRRAACCGPRYLRCVSRGYQVELCAGRRDVFDAAWPGLRVEASDALDDPDQFGSLVSVMSREVDEVAGARDDGTSFCLASDGDSTSAAELEQSFVSERAQRSQERVGVHAGDGSKVLGWG
jgi:hypothetical protein